LHLSETDEAVDRIRHNRSFLNERSSPSRSDTQV
jgi:hypothetical protein